MGKGDFTELKDGDRVSCNLLIQLEPCFIEQANMIQDDGFFDRKIFFTDKPLHHTVKENKKAAKGLLAYPSDLQAATLQEIYIYHEAPGNCNFHKKHRRNTA